MDFDDMKSLGESYLEHHGVEGQKWGVQNGPPYPLEGKGKKNFLRQAKEIYKRKRRKKILKDPAKLVKYQDEFTVEELDEALKKIDAVNRVRERIPQNNKKGLSFKQKMMANDPATLMRNLDKFDTEDYQKALERLKRKRDLQDMVIDDAKRPAKILGVGNTYLNEITTGIKNVKSGISDIGDIHDKGVKISGKGLTYEDAYKEYKKRSGIKDDDSLDKDDKKALKELVKLEKALKEQGIIHDDMKVAGEDFLMHYGILGMKWGVHKAKGYERDIAISRRNKKVRAAKAKIRNRQGSTRYDDRKYLKEKTIEANIDLKKDILDIKNKYSNIPKRAKGVKRSEIWKNAEKRAKSEIPNYAVKHAIRKAGKIAGIATLSLSAAMGTGAGIAMAATGQSVLNALGVGGAYMLEGAAEAALVSKVPSRIVKGKL